MADNTNTMMAVVMHKRGGPEVLQYEAMPIPVAATSEVLVRVQAATINHTDIFHRMGRFYIQKELPHVLGMDVAGEIVALGPNVTDWKIGERVVATFEALGRERNGAYAEYTTLPVNQLYRIPDQLPYTDAASIGLAFTTAWIALIEKGNLQSGERVAVQAASSGVGTAALQIARWKNCSTIAISDLAKAAALEAIGAQLVLDRTASDVAAQVLKATDNHGVDFVLDLVGRNSLKDSVEMLANGGRIFCAGTLSGDLAEFDVMSLIMKAATIHGSFGIVSRAGFDQILNLFATGVFRAAIDSIVPLSQAQAAHERIEAKAAFGKIILVPDSVFA